MRAITWTAAWVGLCVVAVVPAPAGGAAPGGEIAIVQEGRSNHVIVLSERASASEKRGAEELRAHLKRMSGADLPIVSDAEQLGQAAILVGRSRHTDALKVSINETSLGPDGFVLKTVGSHIIITGSRIRGTMYGCTALLEKLGVRWYTPKITIVPQQETVLIAPLDERQVPAFEYREPFFSEAFDKDWAARLRCNGHAAHLDESTGGKVKYHPFVHSFDAMIPPSLYEQHPEYFPLIGGKRVNGYVQRCLSNPEVLRLSIEAVREWIRQRPDAMIYSVSQNDTYKWCECEKCKQITDRYGGVHSGLYLWFVNQIAEAIEKEHPEKLIDTLAYQFTEEPPAGIVPRRNVRVRLCPIAVCQAHPYEQCSAAPNVAFVKSLAAWAKITDTLYIWHYNTNFANYLMPFPDFDEFPADLRLYWRSGVKGIFFQGAYGAGGGGSDAELRTYVMARLLWDPNADSDALVTEWMLNVYGPAWRPMRRWFDLLHAKARDPNKHFFIFDPPTVHYMSASVISAGDGLFDEAEKLTEADPTAKEYVAKARLGLRYVKLMQQPTDGPEFDRFMADVRGFGIQRLNEHEPLDAWESQYRQRAARAR